MEAFNFRRFSVTFPVERAPALGEVASCGGPADPESTICVAVHVERACGAAHDAYESARVVRTMVSFMRSGMPLNDDLVLPANGSMPIEVTITTSVPGTASLESAPGSDGSARFGTTAGSSERRLSTTAPTTAQIVALRPGVVRLRVTAAPDPDLTFDLTVARPPVLSPASGTIEPDVETAVLVSADAPLVECEATDATPTVDGEAAAPGDVADRHVASLGITPVPGATAVRLTCSDELGQMTSAIYEVAP